MLMLQAVAERTGDQSQINPRKYSHLKKKASRAERLTSNSLQSLYDAEEQQNVVKGSFNKCNKNNTKR